MKMTFRWLIRGGIISGTNDFTLNLFSEPVRDNMNLIFVRNWGSRKWNIFDDYKIIFKEVKEIEI